MEHHFDNTLKPGWDQSFISDIYQFSQYLLPNDVEPKEEVLEVFEPRQYTEEEIASFNTEQQRLMAQRKAILVLDLDHTLVHCTRKKDKELMAPSFTVGDEVWFFHLRPGLAYFLQQMQQCYELVLYTFATRPYAEFLLSVIDALFPQDHKVRFRAVITRNECFDKKRKSVTEIFPDHSLVFAVDDNKGGVWNELENLIRVPPYYHFGKKAKYCPCDTHLSTLGVLLKKLHHSFFDQKTCQTRQILENLKELAVRLCPLPILPLRISSKSRKDKHLHLQAKTQVLYSAAPDPESSKRDVVTDSAKSHLRTLADGSVTEVSALFHNLKTESRYSSKGTLKDKCGLPCGEDDRRVFPPEGDKAILIPTCEGLVNVLAS